jgi:GH24 family phage-related lysozyme (muramidase)
MAKLPTLNVDVRVNTRTMQKDIDAANKRLQNIGGKGLAFAGGTAGKLGSLGALGGTAGSAAIGAGAAALTAAAPFMIANRVIDSFASSVQNATQLLEKQQSDMTLSAYRELGISQLFAERLAAAAERADQLSASNKGLWDTFWAVGVERPGPARRHARRHRRRVRAARWTPSSRSSRWSARSSAGRARSRPCSRV